MYLNPEEDEVVQKDEPIDDVPMESDDIDPVTGEPRKDVEKDEDEYEDDDDDDDDDDEDVSTEDE